MARLCVDERQIGACVEQARYLARRQTRRYPCSQDREDLEGAALLGLAEAIDRYNPSMNISLRTFSSKRMAGAITDELRRMAPQSRTERREVRSYSNLTREEDTTPTTADPRPSRPTDAVLARLRMAESLRRQPKDPDLVSADDAGQRNNPEDQCYLSQMRGKMRLAMGLLPAKKRAVLKMLYFDELTTVDVGRRLNVTQSRVSQIREEALRHLRKHLGS